MKWFMSYVRVYGHGEGISFGCTVYGGAEHPIAKVARWNQSVHKDHNYVEVLLSFQQVDDDVPDVDTLARGI